MVNSPNIQSHQMQSLKARLETLSKLGVSVEAQEQFRKSLEAFDGVGHQFAKLQETFTPSLKHIEEASKAVGAFDNLTKLMAAQTDAFKNFRLPETPALMPPEIYRPRIDIADFHNPIETTNDLLADLVDKINDLHTTSTKQAAEMKAQTEATAAMLVLAGKEAAEAREASKASKYNLWLAALALVATMGFSIWSNWQSGEGSKETNDLLRALKSEIHALGPHTNP